MDKQTSISRRAAIAGLTAIGAAVATRRMTAQQGSAAQPAGALKAADVSSIMPAQVFFRGQSATVQMRNSAGIRYPDGMLTLMALVDTSGYSSGIQQRYQAYLITEVGLRFGEDGRATLAPGAYGVGFVANDRFVAMDLGARELLNTASSHDAEMKRPMPLQVLESATPGSYRFYEGRSFVTLRRAP